MIKELISFLLFAVLLCTLMSWSLILGMSYISFHIPIFITCVVLFCFFDLSLYERGVFK